MARVYAPATIGNVGPGFDVLGMSFNGLGDVVSVELTGDESSVDSVTGVDAELIPLSPKENVAVIAAEKMLELMQIDRGVKVSLDRQLPVSGGLGSSAAASVGGALAAAAAAKVQPEMDLILEAALAGERTVAGNHLDNIAPCLLGGLTMVQSVAPPRIYQLPVKSKWWICLVTPDCRIDTKDARNILPESRPTADWVQTVANTVGLAAAFATDNIDLARHSLHDTFAEPRRSKLIPNYDVIKDAAIMAGALGCSISGAGPTVFALVENEKKAKSCKAAIELACGSQSITCHIGEHSTTGAHLL